jgi:3-hydroxybutyryl-CoA dehydratase
MDDTLSLPFERLRVGETFATRGRTVTEADVVAFAAQTGDFHPQHCDAAWAAGSAFGERIAHGMLVLSYAVGLVPFDPDRVLALRRICDAVFKRPVRLGETIRVEGEVSGLAEVSDDAGLVTLTWRILNQDDRLVCRARVEALWRRDAPPPPDARSAPSENGFVPIPL